MYQRDGGGQA